MIGSRVGAYSITRCIGAGGMGEVYEAERADGEFRQRVAIKIVREASRPASGIRMHERFRAERQILSDLNHPNIARLSDGGTTTGNAPYLVTHRPFHQNLRCRRVRQPAPRHPL